MQPTLSVVIPVFNDAAPLDCLLERLQAWRQAGLEIIVVDGGSKDDPAAICRERVDQFLQCPAGRARQQHHGALAARAPALWFLHSDCIPPQDAPAQILAALTQHVWGRFDVRLIGQSRWLSVIAFCMNRRSAWSQICTGDQGLFMRSSNYFAVGGFAPIALMEDIALSIQLKNKGRPAILTAPIQVSPRRWDQHGALKTIVQMSWLRLRYWAGADPEKLHRSYYRR